MQRQITTGEVVAMFIVGLFALGLLIFTALANLALLTRIYPDPQFVGFGLLGLEGGTIVWVVVWFLTNKLYPAHRGICLIGLGVDVLISFTGFMYELAAKTGTALPVTLPIIYVVGFSVIFNVGVGLCYKLIPKYRTHVVGGNDYQGQIDPPANEGPGLVARGAASVLGAGMSVMDLAQERREQSRARRQSATRQLTNNATSAPDPLDEAPNP